MIILSASLPGRSVLLGTLAGLPGLAAQTGDGPAVVLVGEVLDEAVAERGAVADTKTERLLRRA